MKHGGKFWSGEGATYESLAWGGASADVGDGLDYSNKFAKEFSDTNFGEVDGLNELHADGTFPKGYTTKDGITLNSKGNSIRAVTKYLGGKNSNVYFAKSAFGSSEQLYLTMGHEYMHVGFNYGGFKGSTTANSRHATIYKWQSQQAKLFGHSSYSSYARRFNLLKGVYNSKYDHLMHPLLSVNPF